MSTEFTLDAMIWDPVIPALTRETATDEQWSVLERTGKAEKAGLYSKTLAHDPVSLEARAALYDETMYSAGGLPPADREYAALVVSMVNECRYCASVHSRRLAQQTKDRPGVRALLAGGPPAAGRQQAVAAFATALTTDPAGVGAEAIGELTGAGLDEVEVLDLIGVSSMFAWANRLMLGLGTSRLARDAAATGG